MIDKGERESLSRPSCSLIKFAFHIQLGSKYQASINEIENSEQKLTDSAKSVDWSGDIDKTNKGNCQLSIFFASFDSFSGLRNVERQEKNFASTN